MKLLKKLMVVFVAALMVMSLTSKVYADGSNTISVQNAKNGEKYNIYKMLDLSVNDQNEPTAYTYTLNDTWKAFWTTGAGKDYIKTTTVGTDVYVEWLDSKKMAADMETFAKAAAKYAEDNSIAPTKPQVTATGGKAEWTDLDNGYYLVTSTYGIAASVASTPSNPVQNIEEKNSENTTDKDVKEATERNGSKESWANENDAAVGDTVEFRAKVTIAKNTVKVEYHDTMDAALTWTGAANVKVYTDEACENELLAENYQVVAGTSPETFVVKFNDEKYVSKLTAATTNVYVKYSAVLNDNAVVGTPVNNKGQVRWGENGKSTESTTETNTHKFTILKYDKNDSTKNPLAGAKFKLYTVEENGTALKLAKTADGKTYRIVDMSDSGATLPTGYTLVADDTIVTIDGSSITIEGVDSDDYYLEETEAPKGFTKIDGRTKIAVNAENSLVSEIPNESGAILPSTGGIGTTIFHIAGAALVLGAGILLISKKRMNNN